MYRIFILFYFLGTVFTTQAQDKNGTQETKGNTTEKTTPVIVLPESGYNFGKIPQGKPVVHVFTYKNMSNLPLVLDNVQASCGCTTPEWSKEAVASGATGTIKVGYNAASEGSFNKTITITYNKDQTTQLTITGEVWETPASPAPLNNAIETLKNK
jgi:hypothetical protein